MTSQASQPAFYVPAYLHAAGVTMLPILTFYPDVTSVLGVPVVRRVANVQQPIDILDVFRLVPGAAAAGVWTSCM
jgi:hypothetical protein